MSKWFQYSGAVLVAVFCGAVMALGFSHGSQLLYTSISSGATLVYEAPIPQESSLAAVEAVFPRHQSQITTLTFVGDIMLDRGVKHYINQTGEGDFNWLFQNTSKLGQSDLLFGNLEGPVSEKGSDRRNLYSFRMNPDTIPALVSAKFDVLQVANNHIGDWGLPAAEDTFKRLKEAGLVAVGGGLNREEVITPRIIEKNGLKIGFLAATDVGPDWLLASADKAGVLLADDPELPQIIKAASLEVDLLIVGFHFGDEYQTEPNQRQKELAHLAIDNGARLVIGTHPHVVQPVEEYQGGVIAYSLGNFIFDQYFSPETMSGLALTIVLEGKEIQSIVKQNVILDKNYQPSL